MLDVAGAKWIRTKNTNDWRRQNGQCPAWGLAESGLLTKQFCVQEPTAAALTALGLDVVPQAGPDFSPDIVVLAIKPQMAAQVIPEWRQPCRRRACVVSLMAGTSIATLAIGRCQASFYPHHAEHTGSVGAVFRAGC